MAVVTNTLQTHSAIGAREDLEDVIWDLEPNETWAMTNLDRTDASGVYHEWLLDTLVAPTTNRQIEGDDASFTTITQPTRVGNYAQILRKTFVVSGTLDTVAKAGRRKESARQLIKQMMELKNEFEYAIVRNQASSAGGAGTARSMGSMESWIPSTDNGGNGIRATTTASASTAAYSSGVTAPTDGTTTGALTESALKSALQLAWQAGGNVTTILTGATQKNAIDGFTGIATRFVDNGRTEAAAIIGAASVYVTSYGTHRVVLHRHVRSSVVLCLDPSMWAIAMLRPFSKTKLAQTGDAEKHMMIGEGTLVCRNHAANAKVAACA